MVNLSLRENLNAEYKKTNSIEYFVHFIWFMIKLKKIIKESQIQVLN